MEPRGRTFPSRPQRGDGCGPNGAGPDGLLVPISSDVRKEQRRDQGGDSGDPYARGVLRGLAKAWAAFRMAKEVWADGDAADAKAEHQNEMAFPIGTPNDAFAKYFIGQSYLAPLSTEQVGVYNVTFEPGCRNNWHVHHAKNGGGQILVCVAGRGLYQEWGKPAQELRPGDVVNIPAGVKHWHGAAPDSWFSHLAVEVPGEETSNEWLEPVDDEEYLKATDKQA